MTTPTVPVLNQLSFEGRCELLTIDFTPFGGSVFRAINSTPYNATDGLPEDATVTFGGNSYACMAFQTGGMQSGGENQVQPGLVVADHTGILFVTMRDSYNFAHGAVVTHGVALGADIINDNPFALITQRTYVIRSVRRQTLNLDLELATHFDWANIQVPGYIMTREDFPGLGSALDR